MPSARHPAKMQDFTESKHLKRSANGTPNKSVTKKNGAGGRGTWGRLDDYTIGAAYIDKKDPNYDPDEDSSRLVLEASEELAM